MKFDLIAYCSPPLAPALCQSLLPRAGDISLCLVSPASSMAAFGAGAAPGNAFAASHLVEQPPDQTQAACLNAAAQGGRAPHLVFLCGVSAVREDFISALETALEACGESTCFVCRSLPCEPQHHIDPVTLQSPTLSGVAVCMPRAVFEQAGGLDPLFPGAHAWDELSLRVRGLGFAIAYLPTAVLNAETTPAEPCGAYLDTEWSALLLAAKYGGHKARAAARKRYYGAIRTPQPFPHVRRLLLRQYLHGLVVLSQLKKWRRTNGALHGQVGRLAANGAGLLRGESPLAPVGTGPKISVIIRTHKRAAQLRGAVQSVANQTYRNFEIVVIEDGAPTAEAMLRQEFAQLPLVYHATGQPVGRSRAGNLGLEKATGAYCNFLDDDDYFYPDHLEQMAAQMAAHPEADIILGCSVSMFTDGDSALWETREAARYELIRFDRLDVFTTSQMCQIPLLSGAFKREMYQKYGGLHEGMDAHEDWAMWLKYLAKGRRINPHGIDIPRATSVFLQPAAPGQALRRLSAYKAFDETLFKDPDIRFDVSLADMRRFYDGMLADVRHLKQLGQLDEFLEREAKR